MSKKRKSSSVQLKLESALLDKALQHRMCAKVSEVEADQAEQAIKNIESLFGVDPC